MTKRFFTNLCVIVLWTAVLALILGCVTHAIRPGWGVRAALLAIPVVLFLLMPLAVAFEERNAEHLKADGERAWKDFSQSRDAYTSKVKLMEIFLHQEHVDVGLDKLAKLYATAHDHAALMSAGSNPISECSQEKIREFQDEFSRRSNKSLAALSAFSSAAELAKASGFTAGKVEDYLQKPFEVRKPD